MKNKLSIIAALLFVAQTKADTLLPLDCIPTAISSSGGIIAYGNFVGQGPRRYYDGTNYWDITSIVSTNFIPSGINGAGLISGRLVVGTNYPHAAVWSRVGGLIDIQAGTNWVSSFSSGVNDNGQVGLCFNSGIPLYTWQNGVLTNSTLRGSSLSQMAGPNIDGALASVTSTPQATTGVPGYAILGYPTPNTNSAGIWRNFTIKGIGKTFIVGNFGQKLTGSTWGTAQLATRYSLATHQFVPIAVNAIVNGVNDNGDAVGIFANHATRWDTNNVATDLNTSLPNNSGWLLLSAVGINNAGQIIGTGSSATGQRGFLLTPGAPVGGLIVPELIAQPIPTNNPPVVNSAMDASVDPGQTVVIAAAKILSNCSDPDGDVLTITDATAGTGSASVTNGDVLYTAGVDPGTDIISYTASDGNGGTAIGTINVTIRVPSEGFNRLSLVPLGDGSVQLTYLGIPGYSYVLEKTTDLTPPAVWTDVETNTAASNGFLLFTNSSAEPVLFFRTRSTQ